MTQCVMCGKSADGGRIVVMQGVGEDWCAACVALYDAAVEDSDPEAETPTEPVLPVAHRTPGAWDTIIAASE